MAVYIAMFSVLLLAVGCQAHSWIACTDYTANNDEYWDPAKCRAFPRHGHQYTQKNSFGVDTGYNIINPPNNAPCRTARDDANAYNAEYPRAVYYKGQTVVIAHPTKNHVADIGCTNKYIPDNGNFIWRGPKDGQSDVSLSTFQSNVVADLGIGPNGHQIPDALTQSYPKAGFMNAPKFCENTDKALATNMFDIPEDLEAGVYTFMWGWYFNSATDLYTSCWEVEIVNTMTERDNKLTALGLETGDATNTDSENTPATVVTMGSTTPGDGQSSTPSCSCTCSGGNVVSDLENFAANIQASILVVLVALVTSIAMVTK